MEHMLQHANLTDDARDFFIRVLHDCPNTFRPREMFWQIKLMSRYSGERAFFEAACEKKQAEMALILPKLRITVTPPSRSLPLSYWRAQRLDWPDPVALLTQIFLQQILSSTELFLDLGSRTDAFFLSEDKDFISWVPESSGTRWHEPFRCELARLYLGWAFEQERLVEMALQALHLTPLSQEISNVLAHWREGKQTRRSLVEQVRTRFVDLFKKAEFLGIHLHPNVLVWALYELELVEVLASFDVVPNLEHSADELCRLQSRISA